MVNSSPLEVSFLEALTWVSYILHNGICAMVKSRNIGDGHLTFNRNPFNGYINPYNWVDDHPLLYGNNGSLDPGTYETFLGFCSTWVFPKIGVENPQNGW